MRSLHQVRVEQQWFFNLGDAVDLLYGRVIILMRREAQFFYMRHPHGEVHFKKYCPEGNKFARCFVLLTLNAISSEVRKLDFKRYTKFIAVFGRIETKEIIWNILRLH
jgi:hypothetical protein